MNEEKSLKRFLKKRVKITLGAVVAFLIVGTVVFADNQEQKIIEKAEDTEVLLFLNSNFSKLKNKKIKDMGTFTFSEEEIKPPVINPDPNPTPPNPDPIPTITENTGTIENFDQYGMTATVDNGVVNKGTINAVADITADRDGNLNKIAAGIYNNGGSATNDTGAEINVTGKTDVDIAGSGTIIKTGEGAGVYQTSGNFENKGTINIAGNGYDSDNDGYIDINGGIGVLITGGTAVNNGTIISPDSYLISDGSLMLGRGYGMIATDGKIENGSTGLIKNQAISMFAKNKGVAENNGTIETEQTGMLALNGGTAINNGTIKAWKNEKNGHSGEAGTGLYASSFTGATTIVTNSVTGVVYGNVKAEGTNAKVINNGTIYGTEITLNNGTIENNGSISGTETKPVTVSGSGKFIQGANGKLTADKVDVNIYASGNIAENNYSDTITQKDSLNIKEFNGKVLSNSAMYEAEKEGNDIILSRKNFSEVVDNYEFSNYLEKNYKDDNLLKDELFNNLKVIDNNKDFNRATNSLFGNNIYPNMKKQTLEMLSFNKDILNDNVFSLNSNKELRLIGGIDYKNFDTKSSNLSGYNQDIKAVFFGADKKISDTIRLGGILNVGNLKADYDMDNAEREDTFIQANFYSMYNKNNIKLVNNFFMGLASGEVERDLKVVNIKEHYKGDIDSKWVGLQNIASYKLDMDYFYIKPKLEANFTYLMQDSIKEKGDYALDVKKENVFSVEGGIGAEIGKEIFLYNGYKLTLTVEGNIYHEFANPYDELEVKMKNVSNDTLKISDYSEKTRKDIGVKAELEKNNIKTYAEYKHKFDSNAVQLGVSYKF